MRTVPEISVLLLAGLAIEWVSETLLYLVVNLS